MKAFALSSRRPGGSNFTLQMRRKIEENSKVPSTEPVGTERDE